MKPGYKQTDVGAIPEDWDVKALSEVSWFQEGPGLRNWQFTCTGMKVINVTNLEDGVLNLERTDRHISNAEFNQMYRHFAVDVGDIVMASSGNSYSKTAVVRIEDLPLVMNTSVIRFKPLKETDYGFLWALLTSPLFKSQIDLMITGGAQPNFGPYHLKRINVPVPSPPEQRAIATALSDVDGLLAGLDRLIAKKRDLKQAIMQQLLTGQTRLPGFHGKWEVKIFGEVAVPHRERIDPKKTDAHDFCIELEHIESQSGQLLGSTSTSTQSSLKSVFRSGDVLFGKLRAYLRKYWRATRAGVCSTEIWVLVPKDELVTSEFLFQIIQTDDFIDAASNSYGTHMPRSDWNVVKNHELKMPSLPEQTAIAEVLTDMDAELAALEQRREKTRDLKQAMMQELLTGKTRLVSAAPNVAPLHQKRKAVKGKPAHNWQINEAVVISVLTKYFGSEQFPLGRKRYTKFSYLLHRHIEKQAQGYLKKAAGPYNPATKYKGPEDIALKNSYVRRHTRDKFSGFVSSDKIAEAENYFAQWYGNEVLTWLEQFRRKTNDDLELLTTVDMAMEDLSSQSRTVDLKAVKEVIESDPEWEAKLSRLIFSDANIKRTIGLCKKLFGS